MSHGLHLDIQGDWFNSLGLWLLTRELSSVVPSYLYIVKIRLVTVQRYWYSSLVIDAFLLEFLKGTYSRMVLPGCCRSMLQHVFCTPAQVHEGDNQRKRCHHGSARLDLGVDFMDSCCSHLFCHRNELLLEPCFQLGPFSPL